MWAFLQSLLIAADYCEDTQNFELDHHSVSISNLLLLRSSSWDFNLLVTWNPDDVCKRPRRINASIQILNWKMLWVQWPSCPVVCQRGITAMNLAQWNVCTKQPLTRFTKASLSLCVREMCMCVCYSSPMLSHHYIIPLASTELTSTLTSSATTQRLHLNQDMQSGYAFGVLILN